jgi:hypothetical protein
VSEGDTVKILEPCFARAGHRYKLVKRSDRVGLFETIKKEGEATGYVVAIIRIRNRQILPNGKQIARREVFPSCSEFGKLGWFFMKTSLGKALKRFDEQVSKRCPSAVELAPDSSTYGTSGTIGACEEEDAQNGLERHNAA